MEPEGIETHRFPNNVRHPHVEEWVTRGKEDTGEVEKQIESGRRDLTAGWVSYIPERGSLGWAGNPNLGG